MGICNTGVGEMGVGETGTPLLSIVLAKAILIVSLACANSKSILPFLHSINFTNTFIYFARRFVQLKMI